MKGEGIYDRWIFFSFFWIYLHAHDKCSLFFHIHTVRDVGYIWDILILVYCKDSKEMENKYDMPSSEYHGNTI